MVKQLIPAITNIKDLEYFLTLDHPICVVMSIHISMLKRVIERLKAQQKTCMVAFRFDSRTVFG